MPKVVPSRKAEQFTESVIREMTRLAQQHDAVNLSQGFPDFPAPAEIKDAACAAILRRRQSVRRHVGRQAAAQGDCRAVHAPLRRAGGSRYADHGLLRRDRDDDGDAPCHRRPWRRGDRLRAVLRELRSRRHRLRRGPAVRAAARAGLALRSGRARRGIFESHARNRHQHAEQPDRQGLLARRAVGHRRALPEVGRAGDHRRDLRAHRLRRHTSTCRSPRSTAWPIAP